MSAKGCGISDKVSNQQRQTVAHFDVSPNWLMLMSMLYYSLYLVIYYLLCLSRCKKWVVNTRRGDLDKFTPEQLYKTYNLCAEHFEASQFMNDKKNKLIWSAIPTVFSVLLNPPDSVAVKHPLKYCSNERTDDLSIKKRKGNSLNRKKMRE